MTVESVTYITDLNAINPAGTDAKSEGDNHIRNLKTGLDGTFAGFVGAPMTATEAELNTLDGYTGNTADLNTLSGANAAGLTAAELQYVKGVTSDIQAQLNASYRPGGTDVTVADGGTGSSTASGARSNLGLGALAILDSVTASQIDADSVGGSELDLGSSTEGSISTTNTIVIPVGLYLISSTNANEVIQCFINSAWRSVITSTTSLIWSDGTNTRFSFTGGGTGTIYWRKLA